MNRLGTFLRERFDPASHGLMIALFFASHWTFETELHGAAPEHVYSFGGRLAPLIALLVGVAAFFLKLRLYDEIKDYEVDLVINPTRPLARGLVTHAELRAGIAVCIVIELATFALAGRGALTAMVLAIGWSLLMYKEFFIGPRLQPHLTTYAVSHTVVSAFLSVAILCAFTHRQPWELAPSHYGFALGSWCLFNVFEFGRKTFLSAEERRAVASYSKVFGRFGAVALVGGMCACFAGLFFAMRAVVGVPFLWFLAGVSGLLLGVGALYAALDRAPFGAIYRGMSSAYIVFVYLGFVAIDGATRIRLHD